MKTKQIAAILFTALIASAGVSALAAQSPGQLGRSDTSARDNMDAGMMQGGMMGNDSGGCGMRGGMMGNGMMSGMMGSGNSMMKGHAMMPQLPAGNEKLQLKMQAEIMQKVGEVVAKYADQVVTNKGGAQ